MSRQRDRSKYVGVISRLGKEPDCAIAADLKISNSAVAQMRRKMRIEAFRPIKYKRWSAAEEELLGKLPDSESAAILGRRKKSLRMKRLRSGIAPTREPGIYEILRKEINNGRR